MERYDHFAFLPDPLPDRISLEQETWGCVAASVVLVEGCQVAVVPEAAGNRPFNTIDNFTLQTHTQTKIV